MQWTRVHVRSASRVGKCVMHHQSACIFWSDFLRISAHSETTESIHLGWQRERVCLTRDLRDSREMP